MTKEQCVKCEAILDEDDVVWIDPTTGVATMSGKPYCVGCAPSQY